MASENAGETVRAGAPDNGANRPIRASTHGTQSVLSDKQPTRMTSECTHGHADREAKERVGAVLLGGRRVADRPEQQKRPNALNLHPPPTDKPSADSADPQLPAHSPQPSALSPQLIRVALVGWRDRRTTTASALLKPAPPAAIETAGCPLPPRASAQTAATKPAPICAPM